MELFTVIMTSTVVSGIVTGLFSTFAAPHINWGIEKKKQKQENRKALLKSVRQEINAENFQVEDFKCKAIYSQIKPYLSERTIQNIGQADKLAFVGSKSSAFISLISEDLHKQEMKWELI